MRKIMWSMQELVGQRVGKDEMEMRNKRIAR